MGEPLYYRLKMDGFSAMRYKCMGKFYFGSLEDIGAFVQEIKKRPVSNPYYEEIAAHIPWAYYKTLTDEWDCEVDGISPLTQVELLREKTFCYDMDGWRDLCTWRWAPNMECDYVVRTCWWMRVGRRYYRASKARFVNLRNNGEPAVWQQTQDMFWGFPNVLHETPPTFEHQLLVCDEEFRTRRQVELDWFAFALQERPDHPFAVHFI